MGQEHEYYYDVDDFYTHISTDGSGLWKLPLYNPFFVTTVACFFSGIVIVPILYGMIYR